MTPTKQLAIPILQFVSAIAILAYFGVMAIGPMLGLQPADPAMAETEKAIVLILVGFLFGSSASSSKKDDANAVLTAQLLTPAEPPPATTKETTP